MNVHTTNKWDKDFKFHVSSDLVLLLKNDIQRIVKVKSLSRARLFATPGIVACTKLLRPWDFQGKKYWSGLPFPSPGNLPNSGIEPWSPALQADSLPSAYSNYILDIRLKGKTIKCLTSP